MRRVDGGWRCRACVFIVLVAFSTSVTESRPAGQPSRLLANKMRFQRVPTDLLLAKAPFLAKDRPSDTGKFTDIPSLSDMQEHFDKVQELNVLDKTLHDEMPGTEDFQVDLDKGVGKHNPRCQELFQAYQRDCGIGKSRHFRRHSDCTAEYDRMAPCIFGGADPVGAEYT